MLQALHCRGETQTCLCVGQAHCGDLEARLTAAQEAEVALQQQLAAATAQLQSTAADVYPAAAPSAEEPAAADSLLGMNGNAAEHTVCCFTFCCRAKRRHCVLDTERLSSS